MAAGRGLPRAKAKVGAKLNAGGDVRSGRALLGKDGYQFNHGHRSALRYARYGRQPEVNLAEARSAEATALRKP